MARQYRLTTTSKVGAIAFAVVLLGVVGFFLAFGFVLVLGGGAPLARPFFYPRTEAVVLAPYPGWNLLS